MILNYDNLKKHKRRSMMCRVSTVWVGGWLTTNWLLWGQTWAWHSIQNQTCWGTWRSSRCKLCRCRWRISPSAGWCSDQQTPCWTSAETYMLCSHHRNFSTVLVKWALLASSYSYNVLYSFDFVTCSCFQTTQSSFYSAVGIGQLHNYVYNNLYIHTCI